LGVFIRWAPVWEFNASEFQCVKLPQQALDAVTDLLAFCAEGRDLLAQEFDGGTLGLKLSQFCLQRDDSLLGGAAGLAFAANEADSAENTLFESGKIVNAQDWQRLGIGGFSGLIAVVLAVV
jgi:hypothetical protein